MNFQLLNRSLLTDNSLELCTDLQFLQGKASLQKNISEEKIPEPLADVGFIGLSVLSQNLILNMSDHGYILTAYDKIYDITSAFAKHEAKNASIICAYSIEVMISKLKTPKIVMIREQIYPTADYEGNIDATIDKLISLLLPGDIIVDYSESFTYDTERRTELLEQSGILFVGCGVVHDEDEVRREPLLMPGGNSKAWPLIKPIFQTICSKINGQPSCEWIGEKASGHLVLWNYLDIEEKELGLIQETYWLMHYVLNISHRDISEIFTNWNEGYMKSSVLEIYSSYLRKNENIENKSELYTSRCGEKGSGKWTAVAHPKASFLLQFQSIHYRCLHAIDRPFNQSRREKMEFKEDKEEFLEHLKNALYASFVCVYAKKTMPLKKARESVNADLDDRDVLHMYTGSTFFRREILARLIESMDNEEELNDSLFANYVVDVMNNCISSVREVVNIAYKYNIPILDFVRTMHDYDLNYQKKTPLYIHMLDSRTYPTGERFPTFEEVTTYIEDRV